MRDLLDGPQNLPNHQRLETDVDGFDDDDDDDMDMDVKLPKSSDGIISYIYSSYFILAKSH